MISEIVSVEPLKFLGLVCRSNWNVHHSSAELFSLPKGGHLMKNHHNVLNPLSEEPGIILQLHRHHLHGGVVELGFIDHRESSRELAGRKSRSI